MNLKFKKIFFIALAILISASPITYAQTISVELPEGIIVIEEGQDKIYIPDGSVKDIDKLLIQLDAYLDALNTKVQPDNLIQPQYLDEYHISDSNTKTINYNTATGTSSFNSTITYDGSVKVSGAAQASYSGMYGHVPEYIQLSNSFVFSGLSVTVPLPGSSGGGSWTLSDKTLTWSKDFQNKSFITHVYNGITATGYNLHISQIVTAEFGIGTNFYTIMSSDSTWL